MAAQVAYMIIAGEFQLVKHVEVTKELVLLKNGDKSEEDRLEMGKVFVELPAGVNVEDAVTMKFNVDGNLAPKAQHDAQLADSAITQADEKNGFERIDQAELEDRAVADAGAATLNPAQLAALDHASETALPYRAPSTPPARRTFPTASVPVDDVFTFSGDVGQARVAVTGPRGGIAGSPQSHAPGHARANSLPTDRKSLIGFPIEGETPRAGSLGSTEYGYERVPTPRPLGRKRTYSEMDAVEVQLDRRPDVDLSQWEEKPGYLHAGRLLKKMPLRPEPEPNVLKRVSLSAFSPEASDDEEVQRPRKRRRHSGLVREASD
ncbi:hypothetical protein EV715DRAFT_209124 [Schizophyllum commune]